MDLNPIKASAHGMSSGEAKGLHHLGYLLIRECTRRRVGLLALRGMGFFAQDRNGTRRDWLTTVVQQRMTGTPAMPQLQHNPPSATINPALARWL